MTTYENFPAGLVLLSTLITISIYVLGALILAGFGIGVILLYLGYCSWVEFRVLKHSCVNCYYYGKICCLGRSKLASLLFQQGDPQRFIDRKISWKDIIPDFLVSIIPMIGGIVLLIKDFTILTLFLMIIMFFLTIVGNAWIRGSFACKYCKQREIGCPAVQLFDKR